MQTYVTEANIGEEVEDEEGNKGQVSTFNKFNF